MKKPGKALNKVIETCFLSFHIVLFMCGFIGLVMAFILKLIFYNENENLILSLWQNAEIVRNLLQVIKSSDYFIIIIIGFCACTIGFSLIAILGVHYKKRNLLQVYELLLTIGLFVHGFLLVVIIFDKNLLRNVGFYLNPKPKENQDNLNCKILKLISILNSCCPIDAAPKCCWPKLKDACHNAFENIFDAPLLFWVLYGVIFVVETLLIMMILFLLKSYKNKEVFKFKMVNRSE